MQQLPGNPQRSPYWRMTPFLAGPWRLLHPKFQASQHQQVPTGEKPHTCPWCGKLLGRGAGFACHLLTSEPLPLCPMSQRFPPIARPGLPPVHLYGVGWGGTCKCRCSAGGKGFIQSAHSAGHQHIHMAVTPVVMACTTASANLPHHQCNYIGKQPSSCAICSTTWSHTAGQGKRWKSPPHHQGVCRMWQELQSQLQPAVPPVNVHRLQALLLCLVCCGCTFHCNSDLYHLQIHAQEMLY